MANWSKILTRVLRVLLIAMMIGLSTACSDSDKENSVASCGDTSNCQDTGSKTFGSEAFAVVFGTINTNYRHMQETFSGGASTFMATAFAVWLALRLLKYVSSVTENNVSEVWNEVLRKAFICLLCYFIVSNVGALNLFINGFLMPIYVAFLDLGVSIVQATVSGNEGAGSNINIVVFGESTVVSPANFSCKLDGNEMELTESGFPPAFEGTIVCLLNYLGKNLAIGREAGTAIMGSTGALGWLIGVLLFFCFWIVQVCFVFYLVDSLFQMGIMLFMLPVFVMAYAFGPTKKWASTAFSYIIGSAAFLMCFSVIVALVVRGIIELINGSPEIFNPDEGAARENVGVGLLCLLLMGFLVYGSMGVASQLANSLAGGKATSNFQKKLKAVAQGIAKGVWKGLTNALSWGASAFPNSIIGRMKKVIDKVKKVGDKVKSAAGR